MIYLFLLISFAGLSIIKTCYNLGRPSDFGFHSLISRIHPDSNVSTIEQEAQIESL